MKKLVLALLACLPIFAAGTVSQSINPLGSQNPPGGLPDTRVHLISISWVGDSVNGTVPATLINMSQFPNLSGYRLMSVEIQPGTPSPSSNYTITITDTAGVDILQGVGTNLSATVASYSGSLTSPPLITSPTFNLSGNSVASAKGTILLYVAPLSQTTGLPPAGSPSIGGTNVFSGTNTFTGSTNVTTLNQVQYCDQYAGATADVKLNACIAAVLAAGGGIANAQGLTGLQTIAAQVNIGNTNSTPVTLLMSPNSNWGVTITNGTSCGFKVFNNGNILAAGSGTGQQAAISASSGATNVNSLVCTNDSLGTSTNTFRIEGLFISNANGGTLADAALVLRAFKDGSVIAHNEILNPFGVGTHIGGTTANASGGPLTLINNWFMGGNGAVNNTTAQPVLINGTVTSATTNNVTFVGGTIGQPGSGQNAVVIDGGTNFFVQNVNFVGVNGQGTLNAADGGTPWLRMSHAGEVTWQGGQIILTVAASAYCFRAENSANNLSILNADCTHTNMVNNAVTGINFTSTTSSIINYYSDQPNLSTGGIVCPEQSSAPGFAIAGADVFYCDSVNHQMLGNYNNGGFSKVPLVGSTNIWSANQFFNSGNLLANPAGGTDVGSTSFPFGNLWLGTAGTNNFKVQPAATTGARVITITDPVSPTTVGLPLTIASGTATLTTAAIGAGACGTTVTVAATGVATTDTIVWDFNAAPNGTQAGLVAWPTAGNVNFAYCGIAETPGAMTANWRVIR